MIKSLALTNFKSIGKTLIVNDEEIVEGKLDFAPLTIFCGKNSSGKSTLLQSILLLAQTLQNNVPSQTFVLNGPMVKLGGVDDIKSEFYTSKDISIDIDFIIPTPTYETIDSPQYRKYILSTKQIRCIEEDILIEGEVQKFYLSNNLDQISMTINLETGFNLNLENAIWKFDTTLSKDIKELMNKHKVNYSMTMIKKEYHNLIVYKKVGNKYFISKFIGNNYIFLPENELNKALKETSFTPELFQKKNKSIIYQNTNLYISFFNKKINDISNIIPIINQFHFKDEYIINNIPYFVSLSASHTKKYSNIIPKDINFEQFTFKLDNATKNIIKDDKLIGLRLNHFLPKKFVFFKNNFSNFLVEEIIKNTIDIYINKDFKFDDQSSVKNYNKSIHGLLIMLNENNKKYIGKSIEEKIKLNNILFTNIFISENIKINNEQIFKQYIHKSIEKLIKTKKTKILLDKYITKITSLSKNNFVKDTIQTDNLSYPIQDSIDNITDYFQNSLLYIGPLREEPRLQYDGYIENTQNIGIKGENCAGLLYQNKEKEIRYIDPKYFDQNNNKLILNSISFLKLVNEWLRYIGVADSIDVNFNGRYGYELKIKTIDKTKGNDLPNVGVGVSQVLPIVLACLLAPEGTTIIIEQPELHLHPAMQSKLTDFFISTILCNKQLIIETHSEYIINRLRLRAISWPNEKPINDSVKIYFTENLEKNDKDNKKGNTLFRPLKINEYGAMSDWPEGFFDESSENADDIFNAASLKWKQRQGLNND